MKVNGLHITRGKKMTLATYTAYDFTALQTEYETYKANTKRASRISDADREDCFLCGRPVNGKTAKRVHMSTNAMLIPVTAGTPDDSQGWFAIGSECVKLIPSGYVGN
jgi:hypothetical protein